MLILKHEHSLQLDLFPLTGNNIENPVQYQHFCLNVQTKSFDTHLPLELNVCNSETNIHLIPLLLHSTKQFIIILLRKRIVQILLRAHNE